MLARVARAQVAIKTDARLRKSAPPVLTIGRHRPRFITVRMIEVLMSRALVLLGAVASGLFVIGGVVFWLVDGDDRPSPPDVGAVRMPTVSSEDATATRSFLTGEGAKLVDFHRLSQPVVQLAADGGGRRRRCRELVEGRFVEAQIHPADLYALAVEIPDDSTSQMFQNEVAATRNFLAACVDEPAGAAVVSELQSEARFAHGIVERRMDELDVPRDSPR